MKGNKKTLAVGVIGLGHVGLSTAVSFASRGIETVGIDVSEERVASISKRIPPFVEADLPRLLRKVIKNGKLRAYSDPSALATTDYQFISVPTPSKEDGSIDLSYVRRAAGSVGKVLKGIEGYKLVVVKSTVTPGSALKEVLPVLEAASGKRLGEFGLASNPEFLREGHAVEDTLRPNRLVIGTKDTKSRRFLLSLYRRFYRKLPATLLTTTVNAELVKYASNAFLASKVTYVNELARLCSMLPGADITVVSKGVGLDTRIAPDFMAAGLGYSGPCLPKDVNALLKLAEDTGVKLGIVEASAKANKSQPNVAVELAEALIGGLGGKRVALLGLAFKPGSDDMRDAVSLKLVHELLAKGAALVAYDPAAMENARRILGDNIEYAKSAKECLRGADCCILVTEWPEFARLRPRRFKGLMRVPAVVDGRRLLDADSFLQEGVKFAAIGLGSKGTSAVPGNV